MLFDKVYKARVRQDSCKQNAIRVSICPCGAYSIREKKSRCLA